MPRSDTLGDLEQLILLAVLRLGKDAYGGRIRRELAERAARRVSLSTVYVTLMRLEEKGCVETWMGDPTGERGGKAKRYFAVTAAGLESLRETRAVMDRMWEGLEDVEVADAR